MNQLKTYTQCYSCERLKIKNDHNGRAYIGCVIYHKKNCLSFGVNQYNIDFKFNTIHAEVDAVNKLKNKTTNKKKKVIMIVFRINKDKYEYCNAKPCINCVRFIQNNLKKKNYVLKGNKCWYTDENGDFKYIII